MRYLTSVCLGVTLGLQSASYSYAVNKLNANVNDNEKYGIDNNTALSIAGTLGGLYVFLRNPTNNIPAESVAFLVGLATSHITGNLLFNYAKI